MNQVGSLDHVGVVGHDLGTLAAQFQAFGFTLTPFARQGGGRIGNRCIMLRQGYIELMATVPGAASATFDRFLARRAGAHIVALGISDPASVLARLRRVLGAVPDPVESERPVDDADPDGTQAHFTVITPPDQPEGRYNLVRHLTPAALWQDRFLQHPNRAEALCEVVLRARHPARTAAWLGALTGYPLVPDPTGGYALPLLAGRLRVLPCADTGTDGGDAAAWIEGLTIQTGDRNAALLRRLDTQGIACQRDATSVLVEAGGVLLRFTPGSGTV